MEKKIKARESLRTLPGDDARQIMWRFADRYDLAMLVQSARAVARGPVARLVAEGGRNTHEWTDKKNQLLKWYDDSGITAAFMDPEFGGYIPGPKNMALALVAYELAWVDAGAATCSLAGNLGLAPIHERGTPEQKAHYMRRATPPGPDEKRQIERAAFALTEPLPFVGVETGMLSGRARVLEWPEGKEPILHVDKRGRFITGMGFANIVTAAVDSGDPRIKGTCMVIIEVGDPGVFDRGVPTRKLVHQLSSTRDPAFSVRVPASRIVGGYTIKDGVIVPNYSHSEIIEAVFRRTRVTVGLMTSAKLLSAIEPVIRYQRTRFRGGTAGTPGTPRHDLGLQQKEDVLHRLVDIWATGEASSSLGFYTARLFDDLDPVEKHKDQLFREKKIVGARAQFKALAQSQKDALEYLQLEGLPPEKRDAARHDTLRNDPLVQSVLMDAAANVFCPACKLWNTGHGANMMREAVSLMGGYGVTEDCPGFLGHKWMDAQLEATYEGPEAVQRRQLTVTMTQELFLAQFQQWIRDLRKLASTHPNIGACTLATAMQMWLWTLEYLQKATDANGDKLYHGTRQGVTFSLADALCWLLAARCFVMDILELEAKGPANPVIADGLKGMLNFYQDLCHVQCARASGEVGRICSELVFGYQNHPAWGDGAAMYKTPELDVLEGIIPGIASGAKGCCEIDDGVHAKAGPCAKLGVLEPFSRLRMQMDCCLTGSRLAKDRAAEALTQVMIPEALDYPA
jgi:alkylation response protein AidB-like acyl-CoA dehydrogenase